MEHNTPPSANYNNNVGEKPSRPSRKSKSSSSKKPAKAKKSSQSEPDHSYDVSIQVNYTNPIKIVR